eukprot:4520549-Pyramimonas_sp.AAC.1
MSKAGGTRDLKAAVSGTAPASIWSRPPYPSPLGPRFGASVYRATLRSTGEDVAIKVQRPNIEPIIYRDLFLFRFFAGFINGWAIKQLGTNAQ